MVSATNDTLFPIRKLFVVKGTVRAGLAPA